MMRISSDKSAPPEMPIVIDHLALKDILGPPLFDMEVSRNISAELWWISELPDPPHHAVLSVSRSLNASLYPVWLWVSPGRRSAGRSCSWRPVGWRVRVS